MTRTELREKANKAAEKVVKIQGTIERHKKAAEKKAAEITAKGWNLTDKWQKQGTGEHNDCYWTLCDYEHKVEAIESAGKKLKEAQKIAENWNQKLRDQLKKENMIATEMPEIFRQCQQELADEWTAYDIKAREKMIEKKRELEYKEFRELYSYSQEEGLNRDDEQIRSSNLRDAEAFIIDLYNRVKSVTGEVTDWTGIHYSGKALNGIVVGKSGTAHVETILAGGYNIQRLHYRVLVKTIK